MNTTKRLILKCASAITLMLFALTGHTQQLQQCLQADKKADQDCDVQKTEAATGQTAADVSNSDAVNHISSQASAVIAMNDSNIEKWQDLKTTCTQRRDQCKAECVISGDAQTMQNIAQVKEHCVSNMNDSISTAAQRIEGANTLSASMQNQLTSASMDNPGNTLTDEGKAAIQKTSGPGSVDWTQKGAYVPQDMYPGAASVTHYTSGTESIINLDGTGVTHLPVNYFDNP